MDLKAMLKEAMKSRNDLARDLLRIIMGEVSVKVARTGQEPSTEEIYNIIRKLITSNTETRKELEQRGQTSHEAYVRLEREIGYLETLLPKGLDAEALRKELEPLLTEIKQAKNDGQATGLAIKHLKQKGLSVPGEEVSAIVKAFRE